VPKALHSSNNFFIKRHFWKFFNSTYCCCYGVTFRRSSRFSLRALLVIKHCIAATVKVPPTFTRLNTTPCMARVSFATNRRSATLWSNARSKTAFMSRTRSTAASALTAPFSRQSSRSTATYIYIYILMSRVCLSLLCRCSSPRLTRWVW